MADSTSEWVSLRQAADLLGVHPATVRNWADKGDLPSRRTPGGHRRFRKADLMQYAATQGELALDQILFMRPVAGWGRHSTPIGNLYLGGAGTHPGPGVLGGSGWLAAKRLLSGR